MFDRIVAFLLRLYPEEFRRVYGRDALQLMWDRAGHEHGVLLRARLLIDLTRDLVVTSLTWRPPTELGRHRRRAVGTEREEGRIGLGVQHVVRPRADDGHP